MDNTDQTIRQREGYVRLFVKGSLNGADLAAHWYTEVKGAWQSGRAFFDATDPFGDEVSIKLGDIAMVTFATPEGIARYEADEEIARAIERRQNLTE